jgi:hypothetical protein
MVVRHGHVIAEGHWAPYRTGVPHMLFSLSKSFASTAAGFAVTEGLLTVDDKVVSFFPELLPADVSENLAAMRVRDLLTMTSGHDQDTMGRIGGGDGDWTRAFLALPVEHEPGTHFTYNSGATYMVSAIVQKVTGQTLIEYLGPRLFDPLGIDERYWESSPMGVNTGGWGYYATTETIAKFGQLYLEKGVFGGKRVIAEEWVAEATSRQVPNGADPGNDWNQGYGYQFWRCRHNAYRGDGAFGQYCVVVPDLELVIATTSALTDMGAVLSLMWEHILPGVAPAAIVSDTAAQEALDGSLSWLQLRRPDGSAVSAMEDESFGRTYSIAANDRGVTALTFDGDTDSVTITVEENGVAHAIRAGRDRWIESETGLTLGAHEPFTKFDSYHVGAAASWKGNVLTVRMAFLETPFVLTAGFTFAAGEVKVSVTKNVSFGAAYRWEATGRV